MVYNNDRGSDGDSQQNNIQITVSYSSVKNKTKRRCRKWKVNIKLHYMSAFPKQMIQEDIRTSRRRLDLYSGTVLLM